MSGSVSEERSCPVEDSHLNTKITDSKSVSTTCSLSAAFQIPHERRFVASPNTQDAENAKLPSATHFVTSCSDDFTSSIRTPGEVWCRPADRAPWTALSTRPGGSVGLGRSGGSVTGWRHGYGRPLLTDSG